MELLQLRYFCDAAQTENFSQTAKKFDVPPSNISQSIKRLETELSHPLFTRSANRIFLNERGKEFYLKVSGAIKLLDEARAELHDDESKGKLRLCIITNRQPLMRIMEKFRKLYPGVIIISEYDISDKNDEFDLVIADDTFNGKGMKKTLLINEEINLAINKENPLAKKETLTTDDICHEDFLCMNEGASLHEVTLRICSELGFEPNIVIKSPDPGFLRKCVEMGLGVSLVPVFSWEGLFSDNVVMKNIGNFYRNTYVYWSEKKPLRKCTKNFLHLLTQECAKL